MYVKRGETGENDAETRESVENFLYWVCEMETKKIPRKEGMSRALLTTQEEWITWKRNNNIDDSFYLVNICMN